MTESAHEFDLRVGWVLHLARGCVWLSRRVLWVLMVVGQVAAGFLLRQMEFDADRYEYRLVGSQAFERTSRRLHLLTVATHAAYADLRALVQRGQLADNLPLLIMNRMRQMPAELQQKIQQGIDSSNTGLFDTHPATSERIAAARRENAPGILHSDQPASDLFVHNDATCRNVTWDLYRGIFGSRIKPSDLRPTLSLLSEAGTAAVND